MFKAACVHPDPKTITHTASIECMNVCARVCVFGPYSLTFLWGCEAPSQIIIITVVMIKTLRAANGATGTDSDNVSSGWSETREHTWGWGGGGGEGGSTDKGTEKCKFDLKHFLIWLTHVGWC